MTHNVLKIQKEIWGRLENEKLCLKLATFIMVGKIHKYINKPHSAFICQRNFFFLKRGWDGQRGRDTGSPITNTEGPMRELKEWKGAWGRGGQKANGGGDCDQCV